MTSIRVSPAETFSAAPALELQRAQSADDWRRIAALRYRALRDRGEIDEGAAEAFGDWHDRAFNCQAYLLTRRGRPAGTTRSSVRSASRRWPLPSLERFEKEIRLALGDDPTVLEASLTVADAAVAEPRITLLHLFKAHMLRCAVEKAQWLLIAVPDRQIGFYHRMLNMRILSGPEPYPPFRSPHVLMGLEFDRHRRLLGKRIPILATTAEEEEQFEAAGHIACSAPREPLAFPGPDS